MKAYLVGGAVRDELLGRPVQDRDWVVVGSTSKEMKARGFTEIGKDFPVFLHPKNKEQYALARTEKKTGKGYKGFTFYTEKTVTLEDDLARRDLTINAMAKDQTGKLFDPFEGRRDLDKKILRHVSPAFTEDPLRVLRVARFAARFGFRVAHETRDLMREIAASGELQALTPERVWNELARAMGEVEPSRFILVLRAANALGELFPEVEKLFGVPQKKKHHPEIDAGIHSLMTLDQATLLSDVPEVRFAALVHDLGKGKTPKSKLPAHVDHEKRGVKLIKKLCKRYRSPNKYRDLATLVSRHHLTCHRIKEMCPATIVKKLDAMDAFRRSDRFEQFLICCEADYRGRTGFESRTYTQADYFRKALLTARGIDTDRLRAKGFEGKSMEKAVKNAQVKTIKKMLRQEGKK